jgi:outer membrane protein assembly factor BamB
MGEVVWNQFTNPVVSNKALNDPIIGHGLGCIIKYGVEGFQTDELIKVRLENFKGKWSNRDFNISL